MGAAHLDHAEKGGTMATIHMLQIDPELIKAIKIRAAQEGTTIKALVLKAVQEYLSK